MNRYVFSILPLLAATAIFTSCESNASAPATSEPAAPALTAPSFINPNWAKNGIWYDGKAEVAVYDAERVIYGKVRRFEYTFATVKEDHNRAFNVKTDDYNRDDLFGVMKVNMFARIETDNYPYHFLTSAFFPAEDPYYLYKLTNGSQEWCGNTFKEFLRTPEGIAYTWHSYWDGQGDGNAKLEAQTVFEDQLPYTLRALNFAEGLRFTLPLRPSEINSKALTPALTETAGEVSSATFSFEGKEMPAWKVTLKGKGGDTVYLFDKTYPNTFLSMQAPDGRKMTLKSVRRWAYWVS
jgi:hypothetical protein